MNLATQVDDAYCTDCDDEVYADIKEEPSVYKIGAMCCNCETDYGVLDRVHRSNVGHIDEVWAEAETVVREYFADE